ncbi:MAG: paraquat-inducible protein A [Terrimicrobiaceae bacterium]
MTVSDSARVEQAWALVVTGIILYVPANILPVMTMTVVGDVQPLTVLGGVQELYDSGLWPMAAVVFLASIVVPFLKLASLTWILLLHGKPELQRQRTSLRRIVHSIGSWSMVDVFLLSILAAVGQLGTLAGVQAEPGAFFFAAVLVCSLLAAEIYKPRLIWQTTCQQTP